jgi:DNA-directed RNA polymerase subunit RPC12/RpoP
MGACHTVPPLLSTDDTYERCMICWESIDAKCSNYVKCYECKIRLHTYCTTQYKIQYKTDPLACPHCKRIDVLFLYENDVYCCKKM